MNANFLPLCALLAACATHASEKAAPPAYVDEAPLPKGWPKPGPYDQVSLKTLPAYRAAFTTGKGEAGAFWILFGHIKKNDIPMTAPVEMAMGESGDRLEKSSMAFLYQSPEVGTAGPDGDKVEVRDVPAAKVLSYTWQGDDSRANLAKAKAAIEADLADRKLTAKHYRLLGYNGPGTPRLKRTWELQALLKK
jgi:hypothetical protein